MNLNETEVLFKGERVILLSISYTLKPFLSVYENPIGLPEEEAISATFYTKTNCMVEVKFAPKRWFEFKEKSKYKVGRHE